MAEFANYSVNGELLLDTKQFDDKIVAAADKLKSLTESFKSLNEVAGLNKPNEELQKLGAEAEKDSASLDKLKTSFSEVGRGANGASGFISKYNTQAKAAYTTNLSTAQSFTRLGTLAQTAGKRIEGMTYMMRRLRSMGTMVATIFAWDMAMGMIESTKATIEAKSEMESYYGILHMGTAEVNSFNNTLDNTISKFAKVNKFHLGETLASLAVEFDLTQDEMNKAANVVPMIMNEYLRAGRTTEEATLAVKDIMQGEFMRLSRETGVGKQELKAAGWSGNTKDIETLMTALEKVGKARHWEAFAAKANSLNDVILITENRFTEFAATITDKITPWVVRGFNGLIWAFDGLSQAYTGMSGFGQSVAQFAIWGTAMTGFVNILKGRAIPALKEYVNARMANMMGLNAEVAKVHGIASAYAAASYAEESATLIKEASIATEYEKMAVVNNSTIATTRQRIAEQLSIGTMESKALAIEAESLANEANISVHRAREIIITREKIAELSTGKIIATKILGLEAEAVATGGVTGALYAKILGLEAEEAALIATTFAESTATEQTYLFTAALLANPLFWGAAAIIGGVVTALYALSKATESDREAMSAYNKVLEDANNNLDQLPDKYKKIAQNVKSFDDEYKKFLENDSQYTNERIYQAQLANGLLSEEEQHYHDLYGAASDAVKKLKESRKEIEAMSDTQVYVAGKYGEEAKKHGMSNEQAKGLSSGMSGWEGWKKQSYEDYLQTDDFMIQIETLLAMNLADIGLRVSGAFWDTIFSLDNATPSINNFFQSIGKPIEDKIKEINDYLSQFTLQEIMNSINSIDWSGIAENIKSTVLYWINPVNWFLEGSTGAINLILTVLGLDPISVEDTKLIMEESLQNLVDTITYYLNPINWVTDDGGSSIIQWWNTNIADPLDGALSFFHVDLHIKGNQAGEKFKDGIDTGSQGTDEVVQNNLGPVGWVLDKVGSVFGIKSNKAGQTIKKGIDKGSNGTSSPVQSEMDDINSIISNQGGNNWFKTATDVAFQIVEGIKNGLNRHSPGDSAKMTWQEMKDMDMFINQSQPMLYASALGAGKSIVQGMNDAHLDNMQNGQAMTFGLNDATLSNTTKTYNQLNGIVDSSFGTMNTTINSTDAMVGNALTNMADTAKSSYTDMANSTTTEMSNVSLSNEQYLKSMTSSTLSTTLQMSSAWNTMKNKIVAAASQIRSQSYSKFNSLHRTIASFYNQLATAHFSSGLAAGVPTRNGRVIGRVGRTWGNTGGRIRTGHSSRLPVAGGLADLPQTHVNKIMNTAYPWKIADPWFLGIQIPMGNTVNDFKNGNTKKVSYSNFEGILAKVLTARGFNNPSSYDFYWNSQKTNQQVWDSVSCNCYDGAEMILEIASMLGLDGSLVHGSWNGIGHMGAMIGGKLYDMTQFQKHGVFRGTQGVVFGTNSGTSRHSAGRANTSDYTNNQTVVKHEYNIDVDLSNAQVYGIDDLDNKIDKIFNDKIIKLHGNNPATGY